MNDPKSQISQLYQAHKDDLKVLKPEAGTVPHVFYVVGLDDAFVSKIDGQPICYKTHIILMDTGRWWLGDCVDFGAGGVGDGGCGANDEPSYEITIN